MSGSTAPPSGETEPAAIPVSPWRATARAIRSVVRSSLLGALVGLLSGSASALFLRLLASATQTRESHPGLLWALPLAGAVIALIYTTIGASVDSGNSLLLERIHRPDSGIPFRMAPLVLVTTVITHLFGGSAGREGTAIQMGGAVASLLDVRRRLSAAEKRVLLMSGISGGFGSVFGTPLAGTMFGMEVQARGRVSVEALAPCFTAALVGDLVCRASGVHHLQLPEVAAPALSALPWLCITALGVLCAGAATLFVELTHGVARLARERIPLAWMRPAAGGILVIALTYACGSRDYLGLSLPLITRSFNATGVFWGAFALKILFTAVTLGSGFKGGEVTPLFCIGAALGSAFARATGQPTALFAALGFVAVFAGAANTPLACILLGIELFGSRIAAPLAAACILSCLLSGERGIYAAQRAEPPWQPVREAAPASADLGDDEDMAAH